MPGYIRDVLLKGLVALERVAFFTGFPVVLPLFARPALFALPAELNPPFLLTAHVINGQPTAIRVELLHPEHLLSASVLYMGGQSRQESPQMPISGYAMCMIVLICDISPDISYGSGSSATSIRFVPGLKVQR